MLLASAYAAAGRQEEAGAEYEAMTQRFGSIEARAGLALWAIAQGQRTLAERELKELDHARKHMTNTPAACTRICSSVWMRPARGCGKLF